MPLFAHILPVGSRAANKTHFARGSDQGVAPVGVRDCIQVDRLVIGFLGVARALFEIVVLDLGAAGSLNLIQVIAKCHLGFLIGSKRQTGCSAIRAEAETVNGAVFGLDRPVIGCRDKADGEEGFILSTVVSAAD
jgi:hypothetical protein